MGGTVFVFLFIIDIFIFFLYMLFSYQLWILAKETRNEVTE